MQRRESLAVGNLGAPSRGCDSWSPGLGYGVAALRGGGTTAAGWDDRGLLPLPTCTYHLPYSLVPCLAAAASRTRRSGRERVGDPGGRLRRMPIRRVRCLHVPYQLRGGKLNSQQSAGSLIWAWRTRPVRPTAPLAWPRHNHPVLEPRVSRRTAGAMPAVNAQGTGQEGVKAGRQADKLAARQREVTHQPWTAQHSTRRGLSLESDESVRGRVASGRIGR